MLIDGIGFLAGTLTAICYVPQIRHTLKTRSADDVSLGMLLLTLTSVALYEVYAALLQLWPVVIMNGVFFILLIVELGLKLHYASRSDA